MSIDGEMRKVLWDVHLLVHEFVKQNEFSNSVKGRKTGNIKSREKRVIVS